MYARALVFSPVFAFSLVLKLGGCSYKIQCRCLTDSNASFVSERSYVQTESTFIQATAVNYADAMPFTVQNLMRLVEPEIVLIDS